MRWSSQNKQECIFVMFILFEGIFFNIQILSQCIVYCINFQNLLYTFRYQKAFTPLQLALTSLLSQYRTDVTILGWVLPPLYFLYIPILSVGGSMCTICKSISNAILSHVLSRQCFRFSFLLIHVSGASFATIIALVYLPQFEQLLDLYEETSLLHVMI